MFENFGIYGWQSVEGAITAGLACDLPILLMGEHGCDKTEGAELISKAVLGQTINFRPFDVPLLNADDFLGYPDTKSLMEGRLQYIQTPLSIWGVDAALFDEINRASPFIQSKLMEVIRRKTVMGMATSLKIRFAAVNPPKDYQSGYMDLAQVSRFLVVKVPSAKDMDRSVLADIIEKDFRDVKEQSPILGQLIDKMRAAKFNQKDLELYTSVTIKITEGLRKKWQIKYSPRQAKNLRRLLVSLEACHQVGGDSVKIDLETKLITVLGTVPEISGLTRTVLKEQDISDLSAFITQILGDVEQVGQADIGTQTLGELLDDKIDDIIAWSSQVLEAVDREQDTDVLKKACKKVSELQGRGVLDENISDQINTKISVNALTKEIMQASDSAFSIDELEKLAENYSL